MVTAYSLAFGSLLLLGGRLGDLFGRKNTFIIGLVGFAVASVLGGLADSFGLLVAARALQGVFGALLAPSALGMLTTTFRDPKERGRAFGIFGSIAGSGAAIGLLLGGVLTEYASWRWCLYVNVVFAVLGVIGALVFMAKPPKVERPRIDVAGVITITAGLVGVVYGFSNAETNGWDAPLTIGMLVGGVLLIAAFVVIETRVAHPLLPLRVVLDRDRGGSFVAIGLVAIGMFGIFLFLTYYLEQTLGFSALQTGLAFLPMPLSIMISATQIGGRLLPPRRPEGAHLRRGTRRRDGAPAAPPHRPRQLLRGHRPASSRRHRPRDGDDLLVGHEHRHDRGRPVGRRRRVGHGEHHAADRWLDRHRAAVDDLRERGGEQPVRADRGSDGAPAGAGHARRLPRRLRDLGRGARGRGDRQRTAHQPPVRPCRPSRAGRGRYDRQHPDGCALSDRATAWLSN
ncbi:MFS transporter [Curtobacterium sp. MCJR17_043]|nr:MFS transporter [Curtobacterium sp. MCJR17_043]WIB37092.1 MFS transporter [Curtobacterium sp. MCJR17_043]